MKNEIEISIIMPCLNEEKTVGTCVKKAINSIKSLKIKGEVIVVDNGSSDKSVEVAKKAGAIVILQKKKGIGNATRKGLDVAKGKFLIIGDSDGQHDFNEIKHFYKKLKEGYDFVIGNRYDSSLKNHPQATTLLKRIGTTILTQALNLFYSVKVSDAHCGFRGISKTSYKKLHLSTEGFEFTSEMIVNAAKRKLRICQIPTRSYPRDEETKSKISSMKDGWRTLSFLLTQGTNYLFIYPSILLMAIGLLCFILLIHGSIMIFGRLIQYHMLYVGMVFLITGYNIFIFGILTKQYSANEKFVKEDKLTSFVKNLTMDKILITGLIILGFSVLLFIYSYIAWASTHFKGLLENGHIILAMTLLIIGIETIFAGFFSKIIELKR